MIEIKGVRKNFGELCVLEDINLTINAGEVYGLVGASGAGKSTLLRCINGLIAYDSGSIKVDGTEVKELSDKNLRHLQKEIAMIFQNFNLMSRKTVYQNIAFPMKCWKYPKEEIDKRVRELAQLVGISDKLNVLPGALSGGQKQRVAIARALSMNPKVLLSDEATSALDPTTTQSILELLKSINETLGITIIVVTHQMSVVRSICNSVSLLENGRIVEAGAVKKLFFDQPDALRRFLGKSVEIPANGTLLQIMLDDDADSRFLVSQLSRELNINFSMVSSSTEKYRDEYLGTMLLEFENKDIEAVQNYLDRKNITWHVWKPLGSN